jgi:hypothetical protein
MEPGEPVTNYGEQSPTLNKYTFREDCLTYNYKNIFVKTNILLQSSVNVMTIVIVGILVIAMLVYLIAKNQKDKKDIIDTEDKNSVEETKTDQLRNTDKT